MTKDEFTAAFMLGFMCTREGFNGECPYSHLAPDSVHSRISDDIATMAGMLSRMEEFVRLRDEAWAIKTMPKVWP